MILALFALAAVMIIGGIASVIQGFPFVRLESGLAMVIAGATVAAAGAVILALGIVASGLRRVERALAGRREPEAARPPARDLGSPNAGAAPVFPPRVDPVLPQGPATGRPILGTVAGLAGGAAAGAALTAGRAGSEPTFTDTFFPRADAHADSAAAPATESEPTESHEAAREPEPSLPEPAGFMPAPPAATASAAAASAATIPAATALAATMPPLSSQSHTAEPAGSAEPDDGIAPEDDLFAAPEPVTPPHDEPAPVLRPAMDTAPDPEPEAAPPEPEPQPEPKLEVVGTYASGGNTYVMYANGAIEAETPRGRFTFASLDELKAFVEAGGESDTRGAA
ncbi:hypothetical protein [Methylobacterium soli]|uniref:DUF308 domain-containing protein n=1 Tax=Methylobacterium soli TaxID=553447 RepID=A0A6L3SZQ9_9HYPH|nr:hypothetical protein [Methylobacterium soli]KAB1078164.1 hypothetical protein F6X53_15480 [Methylobacterium soli]GJE42123.1 hypothetical protein AEGHOMDF_1294 [Methylobacterium soli]